ncbi:MAG: prolyl oligopeptidase family serine peptidase [Candidatus Eisenbacteria bacterium]
MGCHCPTAVRTHPAPRAERSPWRPALVHAPVAAAVLLLVALASACASDRAWAEQAAPPATAVHVVADTLHGVVMEDPYRWLEEQTSPETRAWIDAQNAYTEARLNAYPHRAEISARLEQLLKVDRYTSPTERNGRYFFQRRKADQEQYVLYVRDALHGSDRVLLDPHTMSEDLTVSVQLMDVSRDGGLLAYGVRRGGQDELEMHFLDVDAGREFGEVLPRNYYFSLALTADKQGCFYSMQDERGSLVLHHSFGTDPATDTILFGQGLPPDKIVDATLSEEGRYLLITVYEGSSGTRNALHFAEVAAGGAGQPIGPIVALVTDIDANFYGAVAGKRVYMRTNWNAPNWRIMAADLEHPAVADWIEIVPHGEMVLEEFSLAGGRVFASYLDAVKSRVRIFEADGRPAGEINFPTIGSISGISGRWAGGQAFFSFQSFHLPPTIYAYDIATGEQAIWARLETPVDVENIAVEQVWYESKDGTRVPMFLVHRRDIVLDGARPTILSGYGGFNVSWTPYFSSAAAFWVERGGIYAVPSLRGGGEFGDAWHRAAMFEKKQNTFDDFIAAAEWLCANGYTRPARLAIWGGSNGGLLVGAFAMQRPDLCGAVVCTYPLLDMLRFHKTLKGPYWVSEYGSADDPVQFEYIRRYSPYHNVRAGTAYPATLFMTGDADTRVDPMHARKMTALMQAAGSARPVLLHYDTKAGHSGGDPVTKQIEEQAVVFSFLLWQLESGI